MKERLKELRKALHITQKDFAESLKVSKPTIEAYEYGRTELTDRTIAEICRIYGVNEDWLRTGEGEMFQPLDREGEIAKIADQMLDEVEPSLRNSIIRTVAGMSEESLQAWYEFAKKLVEEMEKGNPPTN